MSRDHKDRHQNGQWGGGVKGERGMDQQHHPEAEENQDARFNHPKDPRAQKPGDLFAHIVIEPRDDIAGAELGKERRSHAENMLERPEPDAVFKPHIGRRPEILHRGVDEKVHDPQSKQDRNLHEIMGEGTIDFKSILKDDELAGVEHMFVEQGNNYHPDAMQNVGKSALYVKNVLFK